MTHNSFYVQEKQHEKDLSNLGKFRTKRLKERATEILYELATVYPITELRMGMGGFTLMGGKFTAEWDDGETSEMDVSELLDWVDSKRKVWDPKAISETHSKLLDELNDMLNYISDEEALGVFDIRIEAKDANEPMIAP